MAIAFLISEMTISENTVIPIIAFIRELQEKEELLNEESADDLIECVKELIDKKLNENTIKHTKDCLRNRKGRANEFAINRIIKLLIRTLG
jgi:hypothetical protein